MTVGKFDEQAFFERADAVATLVPATDIFSLLKRSIALTPQWMALLTREAGERVFVPPGETIIGDSAEQVLLARATPVDIEMNEADLATLDQFACRAHLRLRLSIMPDPGELSTFGDCMLGSERLVTTDTVTRHIRPALRAGLARLCKLHDVAELVDGQATQAVSDAIVEALKEPCFAAGLSLDAPPQVVFLSKTLGQVRESRQAMAHRREVHETTRQLQEALESAQHDHLDHLSSMLARLGEMAAASPQIELPELIRTYAVQERGELYAALFAAAKTSQETHRIVVAAGDEVLFFDPNSLQEPTKRITINGKAGAVRSLQAFHQKDAQTVLLLGAATGIYRLPIDQGKPDLVLCAQGAASVRGGFNAVTMVGDRVVASHSELGLCAWDVSQPDVMIPLLAYLTNKARAVRGVRLHGGHLYASIDDKVIRWDAQEKPDRPLDTYTGSDATITACLPTEEGLFVGNSEGDVLHFAVKADEPLRLHTGTGRGVESIHLLHAHGVSRLVFADTSLQVHARVLGDTFTCHYEAGGQTLRRVEVGSDLLVATNDLRDRLLCWRPHLPKRPSATIAVAGITGHSVQDVCLVRK